MNERAPSAIKELYTALHALALACIGVYGNARLPALAFVHIVHAVVPDNKKSPFDVPL